MKPTDDPRRTLLQQKIAEASEIIVVCCKHDWFARLPIIGKRYHIHFTMPADTFRYPEHLEPFQAFADKSHWSVAWGRFSGGEHE